jgi:hypothetical protein
MKTYATQFGFHDIQNASLKVRPWVTWREDTEFTYTFQNFFHPFVGELIKKLNRESLPGLLDAKYHQNLATEFFDESYTSLTSKLVKLNHFPKEIDVLEGGPYANYNWELLFHVPLTIAVHLSKNQRFAEAQRWFHYIFDPTSNDTSVPAPQRFWKFLAFRQGGDVTQIDDLLALLSKPASECTPAELELKEKILTGYEAIKNKPFQPHAVARTRHLAYQYCVVMKYLDNLIAWGDSLFRQDTIEAINEATQRYVLAGNILGDRPQRIPSKGAVGPKTFAQLKAQGLDAMGNALVELEGKFPFNLGLPQTQGTDPDAAAPLFGIGRTLYFCIPRNDKLLGYWDTVADRLFKIRHCMNIEGVVRQLALFDPPLDPGMLVKAAAAGIDIGSMVSGLNQPIGPMRCLFLIQKALELAAEVRGLGNALLSAIEKGDGERLALLRQGHEIKIQQMQQEVRFLQWKQAQESTESLLRSRASVVERYRYYQRLLGLPPDNEAAPDTFPLDRWELTEENFEETYDVLVGQYDKSVPVRAYPGLLRAPESLTAAADLISLSLKTGNLYLSLYEFMDLNVLGPAAQILRTVSAETEAVTAALANVPDAYVCLHPMGNGADTRVAGGTHLSNTGRAASSASNTLADFIGFAASYASKAATYQRRADEWILQKNLAARELMQIGRQIISSLIAEQIAYREYKNIQKQIEQSQEVDRFLREKFTNEELHAWMQGEIARLYYEYYRFAFDTARKAEQTTKQELMRPEVDATDYIKFNYWDGGRRGLLSGEALYLDVKRLEMAYHENNKREFELTKHVSLRQLNPLALLAFKATGTCEFTVPEWMFDLDNPGHYMRRIKNASLSIPSVVGPYTSVGCTLSLLKSSLRKSPLGDDYERQGSSDERFIDYLGTIQSIVTSTGNNDSGLFETNFRDERFLPFEGAGTESTWKLELPADFRQFDYDTISDVVLHLRYTARQGGATLRDKAVEYMKKLVGEANAAGLALLFSLKHDFSTEWHRFSIGTSNFVATVKQDHFPYFTQGKEMAIDGLQVYAIQDGRLESVTPPAVDLAAHTQDLNDEGAFELSLAPDGTVFTRDKDAYVFILIKYSVGSA